MEDLKNSQELVGLSCCLSKLLKKEIKLKKRKKKIWRPVLIVFDILPMVLLFLYLCGWFRKCLSCCGASNHVLHTFMEAFQGCYRHQPRDCRYFAALNFIYLFLRILNDISFAVLIHTPSSAVSSFLFIFVIMSLVWTAPYRKDAHNKIDILFFLAQGQSIEFTIRSLPAHTQASCTYKA